MRQVLDEFRFALRVFSRRRGLAVVAIVTLGLGIGLTATMFSIVNGVVLRGLPVESPAALRYVDRTMTEGQAAATVVPLADFVEIGRDQRSFAALAAFRLQVVNVSGTDVRPERFDGALVTANLFHVLGVRPRLGRAFFSGEDAPGAAPVALVSDRVWRDHFRDAPAIGAETLRANGVAHAVVGVMPAGFGYPLNQDVWIPMRIDLASERKPAAGVDVVGRLRSGATAAAAQAELDAIAARLAAERPDTNRSTGLILRTHEDKYLGDAAVGVFFSTLLAVVGVLLIAATNVTNLLLAFVSMRTRELAVRAALGATRARMLTQLMVEAFALAAAGGLVGLALARVGVAWFKGAIAETNPPFWVDIRLDTVETVFVVALVAVVTVVAGAAPAVRASGAQAAEVLNDGVRGSTGGRVGRVSRALVALEVALSFGLLLSAGLMVRTVLTVGATDYGFSPDEILTGSIALPASSYPDTARQARFWENLLDRLDRYPGIRASALTSSLPGTGTGRTSVGLEGVTYESLRDYPRLRSLVVSPRFFEAVDLGMVDGRGFTPRDTEEAPPVVILNQVAAARLFGTESPVGRRLLVVPDEGPPVPAAVVGVAPRLGLGGVRDVNPAAIYLPLAQHPRRTMHVAVRTFGDPDAVAQALRGTVAALDPDLPAYAVQGMPRVLHRTTWFYGVFGAVFVAFGVVALVMVVAGLYGLMAFSVARRTREIGVRMAMGAQRAHVIRLVLGQAAVQVGVGLLAGFGLAAWLTPLLGALLVGVEPWDPAMLLVIVLALVVTGLLACLGPTLRAIRIDPTEALRRD